jgi:hypothetical protein
MNEQELRSIVRAAVNRQLHGEAPCGGAPMPPMPHEPGPALPHGRIASLPHSNASHAIFAGLVNVTDDCVIEPAVKCDHCGYCKSQGY